MKNVLENYNSDGYIILKNIIKPDFILHIQKYASDFLECQNQPEAIIQAMEDLESTNQKAFYEFCKRLAQTSSVLKIALDDNIFNVVKSILNIETVHLTDQACFFNKKSVKRLQYDWHQENAYFPNANEVITLWFPWIHPVNEKNGTMVMARGGHKTKYFAERIPVQAGLTQMKISEDSLADYEKVNCNLEIGDAVLFSYNTPHRTGENTTEKPRTTIIVRFTDKQGKFNCGWDSVTY